ncbi:hypothetical protein [Amycolatopsis sp. DSM 110486]|uniref:hypothetical protein n=1 Tax=Amycolatopsis sp. DSM 110486 TaxID=2865832 RepID=UPI001C69A09C|nr:hypothetical protein [Amycolatopsis sp. DSM 110486]QYN26697.1 hypothetical protein K1T34_52950 [Amycolatopsis sp. DSM 110486]
MTVGTRFWLGTDDWAGLGQWVGGLGSLAAVVAALRIAGAETRRERAREAERVRLHPYYISGQWDEVVEGLNSKWHLVVTNRGTDPVVDVELLTLRGLNASAPYSLRIGMSKSVLLPGEVWEPPLYRLPGDVQIAISDEMRQLDMMEAEIVFRDLYGGRWRRVGNRPPGPETGALA